MAEYSNDYGVPHITPTDSRTFANRNRSAGFCWSQMQYLEEMFPADLQGSSYIAEVGMPTADQVASVIVARNGLSVTSMQLQKLLYYVQAWHLAVTDEPLFPEQIKAWAKGPVVPQVWHSRRDPATRIAATQDLTGIVLDELAANIIDLVLGRYGSMSGDELSALTHAEDPWRHARAGLADDEHSAEPVPNGSIASFYREHRVLGGRTAADLAAGGVHVMNSNDELELKLDELLSGLEFSLDDIEDDDFGGGNLAPPIEPLPDGIRAAAGRSGMCA